MDIEFSEEVDYSKVATVVQELKISSAHRRTKVVVDDVETKLIGKGKKKKRAVVYRPKGFKEEQ